MVKYNVYVLLIVLLFSETLFGKRAPQPEEIWKTTSNDKYICLIETRTGDVSVFKNGDTNKALWKVKVPSYNPYSSSVVLSESGDYIIHNKGNYKVYKVSDIALEVIHKDGKKSLLKAEKFIDKLVTPKQRRSVDPKHYWCMAVVSVKDGSFTVINAKKEKKEVMLKDLKMEK